MLLLFVATNAPFCLPSTRPLNFEEELMGWKNKVKKKGWIFRTKVSKSFIFLLAVEMECDIAPLGAENNTLYRDLYEYSKFSSNPVNSCWWVHWQARRPRNVMRFIYVQHIWSCTPKMQLIYYACTYLRIFPSFDSDHLNICHNWSATYTLWPLDHSNSLTLASIPNFSICVWNCDLSCPLETVSRLWWCRVMQRNERQTDEWLSITRKTNLQENEENCWKLGEF